MRRRIELLVLLCLLLGTSRAMALNMKHLDPIGPCVSWQHNVDGVTLHCQGHSTVRLYVLDNDLVRVRVAFHGPIPDHDYSWAVSKKHWRHVAFRVQDSPARLVLRTSRLQVVVNKSPLLITFEDHQGHVINQDAKPMAEDDQGRLTSQLFDPRSGPAVAMYKKLGLEEHFYGLGEKASGLDKRRGLFTMWNSDTPFYKRGRDPIYQSIPFYIGLTHGRAYGIFLDNSYRTHFDMGHTSQEYVTIGAEGGALNYYFFYGPKMSTVVSRYTELTGRIPLPPRWALGNQACRYSYYPASLVLAVAKAYRKRDLPLDAIYMDIQYMQGYRIFTWNRKRFPNPTKLVKQLTAIGVHAINILDPGVKYQPESTPAPKLGPHPELADQSHHYYVYDEGLAHNYFVRRSNGKLMITKVWPGKSVFVDFTKPAARRWWGNLLKAYTSHGVAGIWNDMNEPSDFIDQTGGNQRNGIYYDHGLHTRHAKNRNVFALLEDRATYNGLKRLRPDQRPYIITRAGFAGVQRYATMWIGDTTSTWKSLALSVPMFANLGLSGETFVGSDIGGYHGHCTGEFLVRSYELAFLVPMCRNHKERGGYDQEPWRFGPYYENIIRRYLKLRYELIPYLYTALAGAHQTGIPILRPLVLYDQHDPQLYHLNNEIMSGRDLLLAPVLQSNLDHRRVYLPKGLWYDFWTGQPHVGHEMIVARCPLKIVPLYVRGGSILPMGPKADRVANTLRGPLTLHVYTDAHGRARGHLYQDDGHTLKYLKGDSAERTFTAVRHNRTLTVHVSAWKGKYRPAARTWRVCWQGQHPSMAWVDGHRVRPDAHGMVSWPDNGRAHELKLEL